MGDRRRGGSDYFWDVTLLLGMTGLAWWVTRNLVSSLQSTLADPEKEKHEQARIKAKANLQRLRKSREDGADGDADDSASGSRRGPHIEDLQLNEYENLVAMEVVAPEDISVGFDDIGGLEDIIEEVKESVIYPLTMPHLYSHAAPLLSAPSGVLLYGPPGCGKTMLAKAVAHESGASFINLHISTLTEKWYGDSNKLVRAVFSLARKLQPAIIFIDEIDAVLGTRRSGEHEASGMVKAEFMTLWDGLTSANTRGVPARICVLGATNRIHDIDEAILRRMPKKFPVSLPDKSQRLRILQLVLKDTKTDANQFNVDYLARVTAGMSGSDIKEACRDAAMVPVREYIREHKASGQAMASIDPTQVRGLRTEDFFGRKGGGQILQQNHSHAKSSSDEYEDIEDDDDEPNVVVPTGNQKAAAGPSKLNNFQPGHSLSTTFYSEGGRRITLNVNNPEVEDAELRLLTLDVFPDMTLGALRSSIEAEGIPAPSQHIYHNGQLITDVSKTLQELQISDGDMLALHVRDMRGNTGVAQPPAPQQQRQPQQQQQQQQQQGAGAAAQQDPELVRLQFLGDPRLQAELRRRNPQIADALNDPQRFAQLMRQGNDSQENERRQRMHEIEQLNRDEFNPDAQARIEEMIRQQNVMENLQNAMEYNPESFGRVHLLYIDVKVNGTKVKALVDSGAQATIMSPSCAEACNIMHLVDRRFAGIARGVGTANIIGRVHYTMLQLGSRYLPAAFTVMEGKSVDLLLGLDILKGHQATIDLSRNMLIIQGEEVEFLGESDIPRETEAALNEEPTVQGPGGTTIGARSGAVTAPTAPAAGAAAPSAAPSTTTAPAQPASLPASGSASAPAPPSGSRAPGSAVPVPNPQRQPQSFPEDKIEKLQALGVDRQAAINALEATDGNVEYAAGLLFQNM